jgi:hypothetical protein
MRGAVFIDQTAASDPGRPVASPMLFAMAASDREELAPQIPAADSCPKKIRRDEIVSLQVVLLRAQGFSEFLSARC